MTEISIGSNESQRIKLNPVNLDSKLGRQSDCIHETTYCLITHKTLAHLK